jgi:hypothetical protein
MLQNIPPSLSIKTSFERIIFNQMHKTSLNELLHDYALIVNAF